MLTTTETNLPNTSVLGNLAGELTLSLQRGVQVQLINIDAAKTSIGSHEACNIQLTGSGVEPVEFVILRGPRQTVVRRWAAECKLNGETFTDAVVGVGDVLSFSDVSIEIVGDKRVPVDPSTVPQVNTPPASSQEFITPAQAAITDTGQTECLETAAAAEELIVEYSCDPPPVSVSAVELTNVPDANIEEVNESHSEPIIASDESPCCHEESLSSLATATSEEVDATSEAAAGEDDGSFLFDDAPVEVQDQHESFETELEQPAGELVSSEEPREDGYVVNLQQSEESSNPANHEWSQEADSQTAGFSDAVLETQHVELTDPCEVADMAAEPTEHGEQSIPELAEVVQPGDTEGYTASEWEPEPVESAVIVPSVNDALPEEENAAGEARPSDAYGAEVLKGDGDLGVDQDVACSAGTEIPSEIQREQPTDWVGDEENHDDSGQLAESDSTSDWHQDDTASHEPSQDTYADPMQTWESPESSDDGAYDSPATDTADAYADPFADGGEDEDPFVALQRNLERAAEDASFAVNEDEPETMVGTETWDESGETWDEAGEAWSNHEADHEAGGDTRYDEGELPETEDFEPQVGDDEEYQPISEEELAFDAPSEEPPVDAAAILREMGQGEVELEDPPEPITYFEEPEREPTASGEDSSINDYMRQLLQRVGNEAESETLAGTSETELEVVADDDEATTDEKPLATWPPAKKAAAPERITDLAAMRELANESTRRAIRRHSKRSRKDEARSRILYGIAMVLGAAILLILSRFQANIMMLAGILLMGVAIDTMVQGVRGVSSKFQRAGKKSKRKSAGQRPAKSRKARKKSRKKSQA